MFTFYSWFFIFYITQYITCWIHVHNVDWNWDMLFNTFRFEKDWEQAKSSSTDWTQVSSAEWMFFFFYLNLFLFSEYLEVNMSVLHGLFCHPQVLWGIWEKDSAYWNGTDGGEDEALQSLSSSSLLFVESVSSIVCFVQTLIHGELKKVGTEYIGTICGSYRRGKMFPFKFVFQCKQFKLVLYWFTCLSFPGAASSGDIDILLTHPDYSSESQKQVRPCSSIS